MTRDFRPHLAFLCSQRKERIKEKGQTEVGELFGAPSQMQTSLQTYKPAEKFTSSKIMCFMEHLKKKKKWDAILQLFSNLADMFSLKHKFPLIIHIKAEEKKYLYPTACDGRGGQELRQEASCVVSPSSATEGHSGAPSSALYAVLERSNASHQKLASPSPGCLVMFPLRYWFFHYVFNSHIISCLF